MKKLLLVGAMTWFALGAVWAQAEDEPAPPLSEKPAKPEPFNPKVDLASQRWWNDTVFYEIYVKSFQDSDGDGVGDLKGLISRLDYLNDGNPATKTDLGVTGLWLMPIFDAKDDHGYNTLDYYKIAPRYGTLDDFRTLVKEAKKRGIKIILDLVLNHTSLEHPWFLNAKAPTDPYHDWYIWSKEPLAKKGPWGNNPVWYAYPPGAGDNYYYGVFNPNMPDLNLKNPAVTAELYKVADFWMKEGIDGYRLDAIRSFVEEGSDMEDTEGTHEWLRGFTKNFKKNWPKSFTVGEALTGSADVLASYKPDQVDTVFQFGISRYLWEGVKKGSKAELEENVQYSEVYFPTNQWSILLTNHDQNRVMTELGGKMNLAKLAATLLLTHPGVPFLYYGEEIGQQGTIKPSNENARRPMQWTAELPGRGFTTGRPYGAGFNQPGKELNVADQQKDANSLWSRYRDLISLRNEFSSLRTGKWVHVETNRDTVYAFLRYDEKSTFLILANLGEIDQSDYATALWSGPFKKGMTAVWKAGDPVAAGDLTVPVINKTGGFDSWTPVTSLPAKSVSIFQLK